MLFIIFKISLRCNLLEINLKTGLILCAVHPKPCILSETIKFHCVELKFC